MADEKDQTKSGGATPTARPQGAGAAETATAKPAQEAKAAPAQSSGGNRKELSGADRDKGIRTGSRTGGTTEAMAEEFEELGIDARLDNRVGRQRPFLNPLLKPQQIDGPEVGHFGEHADDNGGAFLAATGLDRQDGDVLGSRSLGQLGRGEEQSDADEAAPVEPQPK